MINIRFTLIAVVASLLFITMIGAGGLMRSRAQDIASGTGVLINLRPENPVVRRRRSSSSSGSSSSNNSSGPRPLRIRGAALQMGCKAAMTHLKHQQANPLW
ncbi:MAG: hypothetical protein WKF84_14760 [Pyrinomonadaceae bacterium]